MKLKKLLALTAVLIVILIASFVKKANDEKDTVKQRQTQPLAAITQDIATAFVTKIVITPAGADKASKLILSKDASGDWVIESRYNTKARKWAVDNLLGNMANLKGEPAGESKEVLNDFSILDDQGIHLELKGSGEKALAHVVVSPLRTRGTKNFVRSADSHKVVMTESDLLSNLGLYTKDAKIDYKTFAELRIARFDTAKVTGLELSPPKAERLVFTKKEDPKDKKALWTYAADGQETELDAVQVNELLSGISNLYGKDSVDPAASSYGIDEKTPWVVLRFKPEEKPEPLTFYLGSHADDKKSYFIKAMPDAIIYEVADSAVEPLLKKNKESFLKTSK